VQKKIVVQKGGTSGRQGKFITFFHNVKHKLFESILKDMAVIVERFYIILYAYTHTIFAARSVAFGNSSSCNKISYKTAICLERLGFCVFEYFMEKKTG